MKYNVETYFTKKAKEPFDLQGYTFYELVGSTYGYGERVGDIIFSGNDPSNPHLYNIRQGTWTPAVGELTLRKLLPGDSFTVTI